MISAWTPELTAEYADRLSSAAHLHSKRYGWFDGTCHADGFRGEEIPLGAGIFSVVDALDAMTSDRPYRPAMSFQEHGLNWPATLETQFDPRVVNAFLSLPLDLWIQIREWK